MMGRWIRKAAAGAVLAVFICFCLCLGGLFLLAAGWLALFEWVGPIFASLYIGLLFLGTAIGAAIVLVMITRGRKRHRDAPHPPPGGAWENVMSAFAAGIRAGSSAGRRKD